MEDRSPLRPVQRTPRREIRLRYHTGDVLVDALKGTLEQAAMCGARGRRGLPDRGDGFSELHSLCFLASAQEQVFPYSSHLPLKMSQRLADLAVFLNLVVFQLFFFNSLKNEPPYKPKGLQGDSSDHHFKDRFSS